MRVQTEVRSFWKKINLLTAAHDDEMYVGVLGNYTDYVPAQTISTIFTCIWHTVLVYQNLSFFWLIFVGGCMNSDFVTITMKVSSWFQAKRSSANLLNSSFMELYVLQTWLNSRHWNLFWEEIPAPYSCKIHFNIILLFMLSSLPFWFQE
jgi:hypothetical protein